jgi:hypothetical protein
MVSAVLSTGDLVKETAFRPLGAFSEHHPAARRAFPAFRSPAITSAPTGRRRREQRTAASLPVGEDRLYLLDSADGW